MIKPVLKVGGSGKGLRWGDGGFEGGWGQGAVGFGVGGVGNEILGICHI